MAYATIDQLAQALEIRVTDENAELLQDCLDAAAREIDHYLDVTVYAVQPVLPGQLPADVKLPEEPLLTRTNVNRGVEWYKAPATYNGGVGMVETGQLVAPTSGFERHAAALLPLKSAWGLA